MTTERRRFLVTASGTLAAMTAAAVVDAPNVIAQPKFQWRMSTTWPTSLDVMQGSAQRLAKLVEEATGGRFKIETFGDGQIMPAFDCFPAASQGTIESFMAAPSYWASKEPAIEWFQTVPFGMNPEGMMAWYYEGDGLKLWEETYAAFNLVPRQGPAFSPQMAGWFRKKINTVGDFKGLKMRIGAGLGNKVIGKAGGAPVLIPASGIFSNLERGVIDAAEWVGPHDDMQLNLHNTARYYYYPGWHEPGTMSEFTFNKKAYEARVRGLPAPPCGRFAAVHPDHPGHGQDGSQGHRGGPRSRRRRVPDQACRLGGARGSGQVDAPDQESPRHCPGARRRARRVEPDPRAAR